MTSRILKILAVLAATSLVAGCKLTVLVGAGGNAISESGTRNCLQGKNCVFDVADTTFYESFTAEPLPGFEFAYWQAGDKFLCGGSTNPTCITSTVGLGEDAGVLAYIASSTNVLRISPIFQPATGYLGMTSQAYDGSALISGWTSACRSEYGAGTGVCNTKQIRESLNLPNILPPVSGMWVTPFIAGGGGTASAPATYDYTGFLVSANNSYCRSASPGFGHIMSADFSVVVARCDTARPIACCR